ncbi:hypothetical protein F2Q68_00007909 [Brassica cretica]|uniref:Uncharacterized protein n=1 Tax=Brassica cretica TaxID=69181 RepID=A0A8S9KWX0_BRACR|nr:hypothetical protein F2Q68_00007909 [Brassica cretica]
METGVKQNTCFVSKGRDQLHEMCPKASIAIKERLRLAVVAMVPERREAGGAPPLALLVAKLATGGRGGSITSLASRGGFGALAGGCASLDATDTRVPAFAALSCLLFHDLCRGLELTQVSGGCSRELRDDSINAIPCNECGKLYRRIREVIERYGEVLVSQHRDVNRDIPLVHCLHYFSLPFVFGHMHKELGGGKGNRKMVVEDSDNKVLYVNGAIVPRVIEIKETPVGTAESESGGTVRAFTLVEILDGKIKKVVESWVQVTGSVAKIVEEMTLFEDVT